MEHVEFPYQIILEDLNHLKENCVLHHLGFIRVCCPYGMTILNHTPILESYMARACSYTDHGKYCGPHYRQDFHTKNSGDTIVCAIYLLIHNI